MRTDELWHQHNKKLRAEGKRIITFSEFIKITPKQKRGRPKVENRVIKRRHERFYKYGIIPDPPKVINRPKSEYNNSGYINLLEKYS